MIHRFIDLLGEPVACSPPFSAYEGSAGDGDVNIYRSCDGNAPGTATRITNWDDGGTTVESAHDPVLSPDGSKIAFIAADQVTGLGALYVVNASPGATPTMLVDDNDSWINHPMWSPDGTKIVFTRGNAAGLVYGGTVESVPVGGGTPTVLYTPTGTQRAYRPAYSYDGAYIAFIKAVTGNDELWVMEDDGANAASIKTVTNYRLDGPQIAWANTQLKLAYDGGGTNLFVINHDGTGDTKVSVGATDGASCRVGNRAWLDDDSYVVFVANLGDGFWRIYRGEPDGGGVTAYSTSLGAMNQGWMKQPVVFNDRVWFIETASSSNGGRLSSFAALGGDYTEHLDVNDGTELAWFAGGNGFYYQ